MWSFFSRDPTSTFPYEFGDKISGLEEMSVWTLYEGKRKTNGDPVSIFAIDLKTSRTEYVETAKAAHKRIKTLRHPNFLTYLDGLETENVIYVVTEPATTLQAYLEKEKSNNSVISWGLHQVVKGLSFLRNDFKLKHNNVNISSIFVNPAGEWKKGLSFLHNDCKLKHNNVNISSIFVNPAGEWKLGGVDYITPVDGEGSSPLSKLLPSLDKYDPPERSDASRSRRKVHPWSADMWGLGCLIWEVFNGHLPRVSSLKAIGKIPKPLVPHYCELVGANPMSRPNPAKFIENCKNPGGFMNNKFLETNLFLEEIQIKDQNEKTKFLQGLSSSLDDFPQVFCQLKILPLLLQAFEFGNAGSAILTPLLKLGKLLETEEYEQKIVPCVVKMFSSTERATRVKLLQQIDQFVEYLSPSIVNDQIFPNICHGFSDTNPLIRETSVKAMLLLAPKLNDKNLNTEMLRHFARLQSKDDQGGIRTNTTICLGKIACHLNPATRQKVLSSAFVRAMKDPFPPARGAGVVSMVATLKYFSLRDTAYKVLPTLCTLTVDPDKGVRDQTFKAIQTFLERQQRVSDNPELAAEIESDVNAAASVTAQTTTGWTGWAMSSAMNITSKIYSRRAGQNLAKPENESTDGEKVTSGDAQDQPSKRDTDAQEEKEERDSASDYEGETEDKHKQAADQGGDSGWDQDDQGWEDDSWSDLQTDKPSSQTTSKKGGLKLSTKKKEPEFNLDDWADESWGKKPSKKETSAKSKSKKLAQAGQWDDWGEDEDWGKMEEPKDDPFTEDGGGGWDDDGDDWGAIDDPPLKATKQPSPKRKPPSPKKAPPGWEDDLEFQEVTKHTPASAYNWDEEEKEEDNFFGSQLGLQSKPKASVKTSKPKTTTSKPPSTKASSKQDTSGWGDTDGWGDDGSDWGDMTDPADQNEGLSAAELAKKQREEKRKQREKEIQEKRAARKAKGPSRLAAKRD